MIALKDSNNHNYYLTNIHPIEQSNKFTCTSVTECNLPVIFMMLLL